MRSHRLDPTTPSKTEAYKMFDRIAHRYDLLNRLLSLGRDIAWRKRVSRCVPQGSGLSVLDLATGTADLLISVYEDSGREVTGVGIDMAGKMLDIAAAKIAARNLEDTLSMVRGDATELPFEDGTFDVTTVAFGIRNFTDVSVGLREMLRVLTPGGKALILEFSLPPNRFVRWAYLLYFRYFMPLVGSVISGDSYAYRYLNRTVETFPYGGQFCELMKAAGFGEVKAHSLTFGIATIYEDIKQVSGRTVSLLSREYGDAAINLQPAIEQLCGQVTAALTEHANADSRVKRFEVEIADTPPLDWLAHCPVASRIYWQGREDDSETAGVGVADRIDSSNTPSLAAAMALIKTTLNQSDDHVRYLGGCRFDIRGAMSPPWQKFGAYRFVLPRFEMVRGSKRTYLACHLVPKRDIPGKAIILEELNSLTSSTMTSSFDIPKTTGRDDIPDYDSWRLGIQAALDAIADGKHKKTVLARMVSLRFERVISPMALMLRTRQYSSGCYLFLFQPEPDMAFMGCSPERLYRRQGRTVETEAIAGTRPRGDSEAEDVAFGQQLKSSEKDIREHRLVVQSIRESLLPLCETDLSLVGSPETIIRLSRVQHLKTSLMATLKEAISDDVLLEALHPTAAVGGYPKEIAASEIGRLERFDRGWYAGPVGWVSRQKCEFAVAIRSALVKKENLNVYAGAGIVEGSRADSEWQETENKMSGFMRILA